MSVIVMMIDLIVVVMKMTCLLLCTEEGSMNAFVLQMQLQMCWVMQLYVKKFFKKNSCHYQPIALLSEDTSCFECCQLKKE